MAGLRDLADRLAQLEGIPSRIAATVAAAITTELRAEFDSGVNAYGNAWKPLLPPTIKRKRGDARILRRTDALSSEIVARPTAGAGIEISVPAHGSWHQSGTRHMVARKILPDDAALPRPWNEAIKTAMNDEFKKVLR